jgi:hypothetical protein
MKLSWTSLKISIAGAKLSHLVQKDKIWDHGSMAEQARIIFYLVQKAKANENIESLRKQCSAYCFKKLKTEIGKKDSTVGSLIANPVIKEIAIIEVQPGKNDKPDMFCALIRGSSKEVPLEKFVAHWCFVRQGDWWLLDEIKRGWPF